MSEFHIGVIRNHLTNLFTNLIDLSDYNGKSEEERENAFLTRSLAAFSLMSLAEISVEDAAASVTDGYRDNGIDALYYRSSEKILYLVQSKWRQDGKGSVDLGVCPTKRTEIEINI
ncbi:MULTISPECIES: hypothetical protein [Bacillales]|uniref:Uncharacterized protein n=1 Tax=Anoxybacteroides amylolyticum TaxID=294699 RepID=A0A160F3M9_9BACL|nr:MULTISPECIES: hypothetical protein [Bacillaceae]ANB60561.1 hypothetical protein GFC30_250 [Anoxybacillus amylolyticus]